MTNCCSKCQTKSSSGAECLIPSEIRQILERHDSQNGLMAILQEVQLRFGYISEENICIIAKALNISLVDVYGVVTFYSAFRLTPSGRHTIKVCNGTACHVRGSESLMDHLTRVLGIKKGETTPDGEITLETVSCIGACAKSPALMLDDKPHGNLTPTKVYGILGAIK